MGEDRIKKFYWSITAKINSDDEIFIRKYLNETELLLFNQLSLDEQKHSVNVAKFLDKITRVGNQESLKGVKDLNIDHYQNPDYAQERILLIKAGLLHDIGKIGNKMTPIDKSVLVIADKLTNGNIKRFKSNGKIFTYYNHGNQGYNILKKYDYDERFLYLIKNHHNNDIIGDKQLDLLKLADSRF